MQRWYNYEQGRGQNHHTERMRWPCEVENWTGWSLKAKSTSLQDKLMRIFALTEGSADLRNGGWKKAGG